MYLGIPKGCLAKKKHQNSHHICQATNWAHPPSQVQALVGTWPQTDADSMSHPGCLVGNPYISLQSGIFCRDYIKKVGIIQKNVRVK